MREDELALWQLLANGLAERRDPLLGRTIAFVHGSEILVVDVDTIETGIGDELSDFVGDVYGVDAVRRRLIGITECRHEEIDPRCSVLSLLRRPLVSGKVGEGGSLIEGSSL